MINKIVYFLKFDLSIKLKVSKIETTNLLEKSESLESTDRKGIKDAMLNTSNIVSNNINKKRIKNFFLSSLSKIEESLFNKI
tara:strand:- start:218 stop:463 length:246 start_codon:yes stop_codon:yes gene_type:complete